MYDPKPLSSQTSRIRNSKPPRGLWREHPTTPAQQRLGFLPQGARPSQALLVEMLRQALAEHRALELPEIMAAGIAQHGARFNEIRSRGFIVENETARDSAGRIQSRYYLRFDPENFARSSGE